MINCVKGCVIIHLTLNSAEVKSLLDGLLQRDIDKRLGCCGQGAEEVNA